ncbi:MAG TPA: Hsp33 family molecular chaperone HslO [Blastocatellia bacterium]|nr:Hsp33 family molecular chaperone HslO [Blastocatellia bacterium]
MSSSRDQLIHAMAADNQIRCMAAVTTQLVGEACRRHRTFPTASVALGRALTGGLLLGAGVKDLEKITVQFHCEGPIGNIIAQSDAQANARGYVTNPEADTTVANQFGKFDVRAIVGGGMLYVTRDAGFEIGLMKEPYRGSVPIISGEIGEDIAYYLAKSEQINSAVSLGVLMTVTPDGNGHSPEGAAEGASAEFALDRLRVAAAGGYILQLLPGADEDVIQYLERTLGSARSSTDMVREGFSAAEMLRSVMGDLDLEVLEEKEPRFYCGCSRERAMQIISSIGREEMQSMLAEDKGAHLTCHFCNETYYISEEDLGELLATESEE